MAVISTPISGRVRFTYLNNLPNLRINGINPTAQAIQIIALTEGVQSIQSEVVDNAFFITTSELTEEA